LSVTKANDWGWGSPRTLALLGAGIVVLVIWVRVEATREEPLIDLRVLSERAVATTNLTGFLVGVAMFASFLLVPQFAQTPDAAGYGFGASVTESGLILAPAAVAQLIAGPIAGRLGIRTGFRAVLALGAGFAATAFVGLAFEHGQVWHLVVAGMFLGAGVSFAFAAMANLIVAAVPQSEVGIATGINTVTRIVGGAFGAAIATAILTAHLIPGTPLPTESAYTAAFLLSAVAGALAIGAALLVPVATAARPAGAARPAASSVRP
jgi:MFS family permease